MGIARKNYSGHSILEKFIYYYSLDILKFIYLPNIEKNWWITNKLRLHIASH